MSVFQNNFIYEVGCIYKEKKSVFFSLIINEVGCICRGQIEDNTY